MIIGNCRNINIEMSSQKDRVGRYLCDMIQRSKYLPVEAKVHIYKSLFRLLLTYRTKQSDEKIAKVNRQERCSDYVVILDNNAVNKILVIRLKVADRHGISMNFR